MFTMVMNLVVNFLMTVVHSTRSGSNSFGVLGTVYEICLAMVHKAPAVVRLLVVGFMVFNTMDVGGVVMNKLTFNVGSNTCMTRVIHSNVVSVSRKRARTKQDLNLGFDRAVQLVVVPRTFGGMLPTLMGRFVILVGRASVVNCVNVVSLAGKTVLVRDHACGTF